MSRDATASQGSVRLLAEELAQRLTSAQGLEVFRLMSALYEPAPASVSLAPSTDRVGIWERSAEGDGRVFERRCSRAEWRFWADEQRLEPKKDGSTRIVLLGESVARGFLFEPHYSPARVLQAVLRSAGLLDADVVDLSRVSITAERLVQLAEEALLLEPDAIVVFAGNNWHPYYAPTSVSAADFRSLSVAPVLEQSSWCAAKSSIEAHLSRTSRDVAASLGQIRRAKGVPIVFLIPEFNLTDWALLEPELPLLDADEIAEWRKCRDAAVKALAAGERTDAERPARRMLALDGGTMACTFQLLCRCCDPNDTDAQRGFLELARDASLGTLRELSPRCPAPVQRALRESLPREDVGVLDLPHLLRMHLGGALPGKNLFMDYCHLNAEGIRVCMALAAQWLLAQIGPRRTAPLPALLAAAPEPTPETMAVACLHAAHHNWSWGQDRRILSYYCELSLRSHEIGEKMLRNFVDCQAQAAPAAICRAYYQLCRDVGPAVRYYVGLMFAERRKRSMIELLEAAAEALERRAVGTQQHLQRLLQRDHGVLSHPTNLLDEFYSSVSDGNPEDTPLMSREAQRTYYQAFSSRSAFFFVCERPAELILELTWRLVEPPLDAQGVSVEANDAVITVLPSSRIWKTARLRMPASLLREGVNHLIVRWPTPGDAWRRRLERFSAGLESGRPSPVYPVYGQLATLWVSVPLARHLDASCSASEPLRDGRDDYECAIERS